MGCFPDLERQDEGDGDEGGVGDDGAEWGEGEYGHKEEEHIRHPMELLPEVLGEEGDGVVPRRAHTVPLIANTPEEERGRREWKERGEKRG